MKQVVILWCVMAQVTCEYRMQKGACIPMRVHTIVISIQHSEEVSMEDLRQDLMEHVVRAVVPSQYLDEQTVYHLQPSGKFVIGGPQVGSGLSLRLELKTPSFVIWPVLL